MTTREQWAAWLLEKEWQTKRTEILMRDQFRCKAHRCGAAYDLLEVHHLYYIYGLKPWEYSNDCLITWCSKHHAEYHAKVVDTEKKLCLTLRKR